MGSYRLNVDSYVTDFGVSSGGLYKSTINLNPNSNVVEEIFIVRK